MTKMITVQATIHAPVEKVWRFYTEPKHITQWNNASDDWHTPSAHNDVRVGGTFVSRMEAKDGSAGFDFEGTYTDVRIYELLAYSIMDGRKVRVTFNKGATGTTIMVTFEPEHINSLEIQRAGWQAILDNFKKYVENRHNL